MKPSCFGAALRHRDASQHVGNRPELGKHEQRKGGGRMPTEWVSTTAGQHLRGRPTRNTRAEVRLRSALHRRGARFRLHREVVKGCTPDFVLPRRRVAVFVDGCFWHGCPQHGRTTFRGPNAEKWAEKMRTNRRRDQRANKAASAAGWFVVRIWECEVKRDVEAAAELVLRSADALS